MLFDDGQVTVVQAPHEEAVFETVEKARDKIECLELHENLLIESFYAVADVDVEEISKETGAIYEGDSEKK